MLNTVSVHLLSERIPLVSLAGHRCPLKNNTHDILHLWIKSGFIYILYHITSSSFPKPSGFPRPGAWPSALTYSFTKTLQFLLDKEFLWSQGAGWCEFGEVNFSSWKSCADTVLSHISQVMSISSSVGFAFSLRAFCFSPHVHGKSWNLKGLAWCSLHHRAVSHFRLDYGWQVKENENCLYRKGPEEYSSPS